MTSNTNNDNIKEALSPNNNYNSNESKNSNSKKKNNHLKKPSIIYANPFSDLLIGKS